ncbi:MAG: hypothetical protein AVDCRST_MAG58-3551, partial [uncultured Rubrobacteraceae bacterium]
CEKGQGNGSIESEASVRRAPAPLACSPGLFSAWWDCCSRRSILWPSTRSTRSWQSLNRCRRAKQRPGYAPGSSSQNSAWVRCWSFCSQTDGCRALAGGGSCGSVCWRSRWQRPWRRSLRGDQHRFGP